MGYRTLTTIAVLSIAGLGVGAGAFWLQATGPNDSSRNSNDGITGVNLGTDGSAADDPAEEDDADGTQGVTSVQLGTDGSTTEAVESQMIEGVEGTDGTVIVPPENSIEGVSNAVGSVDAVQGIEGIDTVALENLEMVLRMQGADASDSSASGQGNGAAAAQLITGGQPGPPMLGGANDGREVMEVPETELKGS